MYGVPNVAKPYLLNGNPEPDIQTGVPQSGSLQNDLRESLGLSYLRRPFISGFNFKHLPDCTSYIGKLDLIDNGPSYPLNSVVLSADKAGSGYQGTTYVLDNVKKPIYINNPVVATAKTSLANIGIPGTSVLYRESNPGMDVAVVSAADISCYVGWGLHKFNNAPPKWAIEPTSLTLSGSSTWYALQTIESICGEWPAIPSQWPLNRGVQQSYVARFSKNSFGGNNWNYTPITATSTVYEPTPDGVAQPRVWLPLWAAGHPAAQCFWSGKPSGMEAPGLPFNPNYIQVTGDPLVRR